MTGRLLTYREVCAAVTPVPGPPETPAANPFDVLVDDVLGPRATPPAYYEALRAELPDGRSIVVAGPVSGTYHATPRRGLALALAFERRNQ